MRIRPQTPRTLGQVTTRAADAIGRCVDGQAPWPLLLTGPAGTGKTRAALVLLDHTLFMGEYYSHFAYFDLSELCQLKADADCGRLRESDLGLCTEDNHLLRPRTFWERVGRAPLVVADELGAREKVSDSHYETLKKLLDVREGQPLLLCSNLNLQRLAELYDDRIASRIGAGTVVKLAGADRRQRTAKTNNGTAAPAGGPS